MNINSGFSDGLNSILAGGPEPLHYVTGKQFHRAQRFDKSKITEGKLTDKIGGARLRDL